MQSLWRKQSFKLLRKKGISMMVKWLRLCASNAKYVGSIRREGTKIPHGAWQKKTREGVIEQMR